MPRKPSDTPYDRWFESAKAVAQAENPLRVPYDVALKESVQVAGFVSKYWEPTDTLPGLKRVKSRLPESTGDDIISLVHAVQAAQTKLLLLVDPVVVDLGERARFLIDELESAVEFLLDDGVEEPADAKLAAIQEFHAQNGQRSSALHQALNDYAALAASLKDRLVKVDDAFDAALIDEAQKLATTLAAAPAAPPSAASQTDVKEAVKLRNGLLVLMLEKIALVRKAAARVFAGRPEILREVTSTYERRRRAAARRAKAARPKDDARPKDETGATPPAGTG